MADADKEFKIHIATTADTSGTGNIIGEFEQIQQRLSGVYQGTRDVRQVWMELDRAIPGTGQALEAFMTGPLGVIVGMGAALDFAVTVLKKFNEEMDKVLDEDLTGPLDQADAIAQKWNGVADAINRATEAFNSARAIYERRQKGIEEQPGLTPQQKLQEELSNKITEAANAQHQADNAKRKADAFKLPESDEKAKAEAKAEQEIAATRRKQGEDAKGEASRIQDAAGAPGISTLTTGGFWEFAKKQIMEHGLAFWNYQTGGQVIKELQGQGKDQIDIANAGDASAARMDALIKERDAARKDAETTAAEAEKLKLEAALDSNPNNQGSLAAKIAQQKTFTTGENTVNAALQRVSGDLSMQGSAAQNTLQDAAEAMRTAYSVIQQLAAAGDDVKDLKRNFESLKAQIAAQHSTGTQ